MHKASQQFQNPLPCLFHAVPCSLQFASTYLCSVACFWRAETHADVFFAYQQQEYPNVMRRYVTASRSHGAKSAPIWFSISYFFENKNTFAGAGVKFPLLPPSAKVLGRMTWCLGDHSREWCTYSRISPNWASRPVPLLSLLTPSPAVTPVSEKDGGWVARRFKIIPTMRFLIRV